MLLTSLVFVVFVRVVYPSWATTPRNFQGRRSCTAVCQIVREDVAISLMFRMVVLGFDIRSSFSLHARGSF